MENSDSQGLNRRKSVRITDRILLAFEPVDRVRYETVYKDYKEGISLYNYSGVVDLQMFVSAQNALDRIRERDKDLAEFLQHMDTKINLLLRKVSKEKTPLDALELRKVTLSGSGICFRTDRSAEVDEILGFHIVLLPEHTYVFCFGSVVTCDKTGDPSTEDTYRVAAEFVLLTDEDREKIIQHNFKQQSLALRNKRLSKDV